MVGKEAIKLNKRINDIAKVISDPDVWNVNIASRERMDQMEQRVDELSSRVQGIGYLVKRLVMNKLIDKDQLRVLEQPMSGSADD